MQQPIVSIIIANWNGLKFLEKCLASLASQTYRNFEIIIIDNGSNDGSVQFIRDKHPQVNILENKTNIGFASANNQGIKAARGKYIFLLNNDTIIDRDGLYNLVKKADASPLDVGMWACKILSLQYPPIIDSVGGLLISNSGIAKGRGRNEKDIKQYDKDEVFIPSACAGMYRKEMLEQIGLFDEDFFAYCEDTDLGFRARLAGWKADSVPDAVVYHYYSGTAGRYSPIKAYLVERNHIWVALKNFPFSMLVTLPLNTLWRYLLQAYAVTSKKGAGARYAEEFSKASLLPILLKANWDAIKGLSGIIRKRRHIQAKRVVSKKEIACWFKKYGIRTSEIVFKD